MFGSSGPISPALEVCPHIVDATLIITQFGSLNPNLPPLLGIQEQHHDASKAQMIDVEGLQGLGDILLPTQLMIKCILHMRRLDWDKGLIRSMC